MRRTALLGLTLLLPALGVQGCQYAADPTVGFRGFIADTHTIHANPNAPEARSENERLVRGETLNVEPLEAESGNVWPGPPAAIPTLQDVQKLNNFELLPPPNVPGRNPPGMTQP